MMLLGWLFTSQDLIYVRLGAGYASALSKGVMVFRVTEIATK
jgi:hypothetical protein